ncbi:non-ribosomal peptide synthetase [Sphingomonas solaris]|uniref:Non-ribosomal peptide synthetase n=1 Tax=Alterirhizorhabdus solaris TaxID=2529389 RepID=A0A558R958_9SPHN|nr:non-ribosomal peptide synthetase [Sphingomonas solaris]TVV75822.1 non-ribosomal peptide synthetase [Sphingomonas solaris]
MTGPWHWQASPFAPPPAARTGQTLSDALLDLAEARPHATAVIDGGRRTSVAELAGLAGGLARTIAAAGAAPGPVALIQSAGVDAVAAWFACAIAGRPLLLLEPHNPPGRNAELIALAGATLILHDAGVRHAVPEGLDGVIAIVPDGGTAPFARGAGLDPAAPAMIFPTSGSTGEPKLITYAARTMQAKMQASVGLMGAAPGEVVLIAGSHGNFGFVHHALVFLLAGGALCLLDLRGAGLAALFATIRDEGVGHVRFTPSLFRAAAGQPEAAAALCGLKGVRFSGEPLLWNDVETARRILDPACRIQNVYGSTESAIFIWTDDRALAGDRAVAPIGRIYPLWEFAIRADADTDPREGRLFIRSRHQALGDWKAGRIDGTRFPDDRDDLRLYDTGDIVRQEADGALTMLGRADRVVKVNGHRISLAEVEAHLLAMPGCAQAAAIERPGPRGGTLAAFLTRPGEAGGETEARAWLAARLPAAMVPARLMRVEAMPLLPGGKLNYRALAALLDEAPAAATAVTATDDLSRLRALWNEVLQRPAADEDPDRDFSDLGGDSLRLLELRLAIERAFGRDIDVEAFLDRPTLRRLAGLAGIAGLAPQAAVATGTIDFRRVRPATGPSRGVALSMPGWSGAAVAGPWLAADTFAGFDVWACSVTLPVANMVDDGHWLEVAQRIAAAVEAGECPPPAVLFGYSIAGYVAWLVDRLLAAGGARPGAVICLDTVPMHRPGRLANRAARRVLATTAASPPGRMLLLRRAALRPIVSPGVVRLCWTAADADLDIVTVRTLEHPDMESTAVLEAVRPAIAAFLDRRPVPQAPVAVETVSGLLFDLIAGEQPVTAERLARVIGDLPKSGTRLSLAAVQYLAVAHGDLPAARAALTRLGRAGPPSPALRYAARVLDDLAAGRTIRGAPVARDPAIGSFAAVDRALAIRFGDPGSRGRVAGFARRVGAIAGAGGWWRMRSAEAFGRNALTRAWRALRRRR